MAQILSGQRRSPSRPRARDDDSTTPDEGGPWSLDEDAVHDVLRVGRRRTALRMLHEHGGLASIGALAECVAAEENGVDRDAVGEDQRKRVHVALSQSHLPKMADHGVIAYDRHAGVVRLEDPARIVLRYLYFDPRDGDVPSPAGENAASSLRGVVRRLFDR